MAESSSAAGPQRVALLARPGKAADNLVEALRQSGADLVLVADPNGLDEATLLAARPQAVLVALEPGIEPAVDRLDAVLSSPSLTVIFDEADLAAHRAGWDAARWVRHLSAKLNHHQRVLPPGGEADIEEWYPSPGHLPSSSSAFVDLDMGAFAEEAAARAGSVPTDGMSLDVGFDAAQPTMSIEALISPVVETLPTAGTQGGDPWGDDVGLDVADIKPVGFAPERSESQALDTRDDVARDLDTLDLDTFDLGTLALETVETDAIDGDAAEFDGAVTDSVEMDSLEIDLREEVSFETDSLQTAPLETAFPETRSLETAPLETAPLEADVTRIDAIDLEVFGAETLKSEERAPAADATSVQPMQFDDDAFFIESLSADATKPMSFDDAPTFEVETPRFDDAPAASFEPSFDLDTTVPVASPPLSDTPGTPATKEPLDFALDVGDAPAQNAGDAAAAVGDSRSTARNLDLTSLEARISGLSLVDIDMPPQQAPREIAAYVDFTDLDAGQKESAPANAAPADTRAELEAAPSPPPLPTWESLPPSAVASTPAPQRFSTPSDIGRGLVVIEAGLGGPDPVRQVLAGLPATFPMPVLVRLHLQGGRYDRLVAQMERASSLPVMLAEVGDFVRTGCIYFLPEGIGLNALPGGFEFIAHPSPAMTIFAALPAQDSAMLFLSGSDAGLIEDAMQAVDDGALVVAQSPEDCYDGAACAYLRSRGAASGLPPELAARLVARWPS
ncbi:MAG: hypothetical protein IT473_15865 [Lysobacter sp.]|nr:hypothetical protein [Lysobacter sp.]